MPADCQHLTEQQTHKAVVQHLKTRSAQDVFFFHVFSGGYRRPTEAAIYKGLGAKAGLPDLILIKSSRVYGLELKTILGQPSPVQIATLQHMQRCGATVAVARGLDAALRQLEEWGLLQPSTGKA